MSYTFTIPKTGKDIGKIFVERNGNTGNCIEKTKEQLVGLATVIKTELKENYDNDVSINNEIDITTNN